MDNSHQAVLREIQNFELVTFGFRKTVHGITHDGSYMATFRQTRSITKSIRIKAIL